MAEPLVPFLETVREEWIDSFGHMNMAYYTLVFDSGTFAFWNHVTRGRPEAERSVMAYAVVEAHINYVAEVSEGDSLRITTQLIEADAKRFRLFHEMHQVEKGYLAATNEVMALGFNLESRSVAGFSPEVRAEIDGILASHKALPAHRNVGRAIGNPRKP